MIWLARALLTLLAFARALNTIFPGLLLGRVEEDPHDVDYRPEDL